MLHQPELIRTAGLYSIHVLSEKRIRSFLNAIPERYHQQDITLGAGTTPPSDIDYLSIDTEGSELEILNEFDFERWNVRIFTCEHNFTDSRKPIQDLMARHGYRHVHEKNSLFDDWFVKD